jgi:hypothetical protein
LATLLFSEFLKMAFSCAQIDPEARPGVGAEMEAAMEKMLREARLYPGRRRASSNSGVRNGIDSQTKGQFR